MQWNPAEFCYLHDWNVVFVEDGKNFRQVLAAQEVAKEKINDQPTAVVYRTIKGWLYGIEGRKSHGAGHGYCAEEYYQMLAPLQERFGIDFPGPSGDTSPTGVEKDFFDTLMVIRSILEENREISEFFGTCLVDADDRLTKLDRKKRENAPDLSPLYTDAVKPDEIPDECTYKPGTSQTLRAALGEAFNHLNKITGGSFIGAASDLLDSTSISKLAKGFSEGFYNAVSNPDARLIATGGICEDCMGAFLSGVSAYGTNIGAGSSYGAFIAALQHIAARLHGIGQQARHSLLGEPYRPFIIVCAHAGLKTGEDGPTHADPQALQLLQGNFPAGVMITLTPWDPQEVYPMLVAALQGRAAVIAPFVTRPGETIIGREASNLPPATAAVDGIYAMRRADPDATPYHGTLIMQGSGVTNTFVTEVLPRIDEAGLNMNIYYVSSAELFSMLSEDRQDEIYPEELAAEAMGMTGFTLPTLYRWVTSREGRNRSVHAFRCGHYLGSGKAHKVLEEAGLHGDGQWKAVKEYADWMEQSTV